MPQSNDIDTGAEGASCRAPLLPPPSNRFEVLKHAAEGPLGVNANVMSHGNASHQNLSCSSDSPKFSTSHQYPCRSVSAPVEMIAAPQPTPATQVATTSIPESDGEGSSSSRSPQHSGRQRRADYRPPRQSSGLVFNPGPATVECVQNSKPECRFSLSRGESGEQMLTLLEESQKVPHTILDSSRGSTSMVTTRQHSEATASHPTPVVPAGELFARFVTADNITLARRTFKELIQQCPTPNNESLYRRIQRHCNGNLPWRARSIWTMLDAKAKQPEYTAAPLARTRAVVCGAGPCGLRAALELALLRADVTIVEKRSVDEAFCRINRLHLWEWCKQDLLGWGAKIFDPPGGTFGGDNDFCHISISELQLLLFKNALLLGVHFLFGTEAKGLETNTLLCRDGTRLPCDALLLADGANSPLSRVLGLRSVALGLRGKGSAIGVVANFVNNRDPQQMALRQFAWARQFNVPLFTQLEEQTSINLENVVYYKGQAHHYMVMTPTKRSLLESGVLRDGSSRKLLSGSNVDIQQLSAMVKRIASFFGLPTELCESQGVMIFDFNGGERLENPATIIGDVFACTVGDALLEPFWPEGLGIMRGFMSVLDAVAAVVVAAGGQKKAAVAQMAATYNILKSVGAQTAKQCLQKDIRRYRLNPKSRYICSHMQ